MTNQNPRHSMHRDINRLEGIVSRLDTQVNAISSSVEHLSETVHQLAQSLARVESSAGKTDWRTVMALAGFIITAWVFGVAPLKEGLTAVIERSNDFRSWTREWITHHDQDVSRVNARQDSELKHLRAVVHDGGVIDRVARLEVQVGHTKAEQDRRWQQFIENAQWRGRVDEFIKQAETMQ